MLANYHVVEAAADGGGQITVTLPSADALLAVIRSHTPNQQLPAGQPTHTYTVTIGSATS